MSEVERIEVEIYGTDTDGSYLGRLETYTVGGRTREDELQDELTAAKDRINWLERELNAARAGGGTLTSSETPGLFDGGSMS